MSESQSQPQSLSTFLLQAVESLDAFRNSFYELLFNILKNSKHNDFTFLQAIQKTSTSKASSFQRFYSIYLLLKATELPNQEALMARIASQKDLLSSIYRIAHTDIQNSPHFNQRGASFYGEDCSADLKLMGVNYVRLCYEAIISWGEKYGSTDQNSLFYVYYYNSEMLKEKGAVPDKFYFINKNYDLAFKIYNWNYWASSPPPMKSERVLDLFKAPESSSCSSPTFTASPIHHRVETKIPMKNGMNVDPLMNKKSEFAKRLEREDIQNQQENVGDESQDQINEILDSFSASRDKAYRDQEMMTKSVPLKATANFLGDLRRFTSNISPSASPDNCPEERTVTDFTLTLKDTRPVNEELRINLDYEEPEKANRVPEEKSLRVNVRRTVARNGIAKTTGRALEKDLLSIQSSICRSSGSIKKPRPIGVSASFMQNNSARSNEDNKNHTNLMSSDSKPKKSNYFNWEPLFSQRAERSETRLENEGPLKKNDRLESEIIASQDDDLTVHKVSNFKLNETRATHNTQKHIDARVKTSPYGLDDTNATNRMTSSGMKNSTYSDTIPGKTGDLDVQKKTIGSLQRGHRQNSHKYDPFSKSPLMDQRVPDLSIPIEVTSIRGFSYVKGSDSLSPVGLQRFSSLRHERQRLTAKTLRSSKNL